MSVGDRVRLLGEGPLTEDALIEHIWPLFSLVKAAEAQRGEIYLANHSLGRPLDRMANDVTSAIALWYARMDESWSENGWLGAIESFRMFVAALVGLARADAVVPKTSAGQGLRTVLNALPMDGSVRPIRIVATRGEFDSIDFILKTYAHKGRAEVCWIDAGAQEGGVPIVGTEDILEAITPGVDLVVVSPVFFGTGQVLQDLPSIVARAHEIGALVLADAYHAAGVIPLNMQVDDIDFMIGGSYKYIRGGPGACWLAIHPKHLDGELRTLDTGWFAKRSTFSYERSDEPLLKEGGDGWMESTPPVVTVYQALAGLEFTLAMGVARLRDYSLRQQAILRGRLKEAGVPVVEPARPEERGAFSLVMAENASEVVQRLKTLGVNVDSRGKFVRFGPDLLNTEEEFLRAAQATARAMQV